MKSIEIDRSKRLKEEPEKGHNRWHPDISPVVAADPGEEVVLETRDASDCQMKPTVSVEDFDSFDPKVAHPLTGPVYINGAEPGDLLEIEVRRYLTGVLRLDAEPPRRGFPQGPFHRTVRGPLGDQGRVGDF